MKYIYIYETKESKKLGLIKIGEANNIFQRIQSQLNNASVFTASSLNYNLLYKTEAKTNDDLDFRDHYIHAALASKGYPKRPIVSNGNILKSNTEWFKIDVNKAKHLIEELKKGKLAHQIDIDRIYNFPMRPEQESAVRKTVAYFDKYKDATETVEMLWNAKMRFGKTFAAYQLAKEKSFSRVLVLTYKPAVQDAWQNDLEQHVAFDDYVFLCKENLRDINSQEKDSEGNAKNVVAFASYQDILGVKGEDESIKDKHTVLFETEWDLVIIDEFHYGSGTEKAKEIIAETIDTKKELKAALKEAISDEDELAEEEASSKEFEKVISKSIKSKYRLFLSGTPFKALADSRFDRDAIFNWTYTDEQKAKEQWTLNNPTDPDSNPYKSLPQIKLYAYKVSEDLIDAGKQDDKDEFSLNYFFKTVRKKSDPEKRIDFINKDAVINWMNLISGMRGQSDDGLMEQIKNVDNKASHFPFDQDGEMAGDLDHTLWYLNRVDSAYALKELLQSHPIFSQYTIIMAAGKGIKSGVDAVSEVREKISYCKKSITLSVGKLTTGVSIPEWKGVVFLRDTDSPENYFQTAFRAQTPYTNPDTKSVKETCYILDFSPNRSLKLLTSYSEKLGEDSHLATSQEKIAEFVRYLPVLMVEGNNMHQMKANEVFSFELNGVSAMGLGKHFISRNNINLSAQVIDNISSDPDVLAKCSDIFNRIKKYKKFIGASEKEEDYDVDLASLDVNNKRIKDLETKEGKDKKEKTKIEKEIDEVEIKIKSEREKTRELLKTLLSRLPIFMYLTDATEENLEHVIDETENDLFRKTTGITVQDFKYLIELGVFKVDNIDGYILKFVELENKNYEFNNNIN